MTKIELAQRIVIELYQADTLVEPTIHFVASKARQYTKTELEYHYDVARRAATSAS